MSPLTIARTTRAFVRGRRRIELSQSYGRCLSSSASVTPEPSNSVDTDDAPSASNISPINTSLALSVHFRHPDLGMKDYEILSRATAFLLQVDPPNPSESEHKHPSAIPSKSDADDASSRSHDSQGYVKKSAFPHLKENIDIRKKLLQKQDYKYDPVTGPTRHAHQLNWLEFCPVNFRPKVHVVASSHVISPWLWPKYYGQDWLKVVEQEHVRYSLEVWGQPSDNNKRGKKSGIRGIDEQGVIHHDGKLQGSHEPLAKFALNPFPIHHPKDMDVAVIHLKQEDTALDHMMKLGIRPLHLPTMHELETSDDPVFEPGQRVLFQGFEVYEANKTDEEALSKGEEKKSGDVLDDERMFYPYSSLGTQTFASPDRFLAKTKGGPIPEGMCGGPVILLPDDTVATDDTSTTPLTIRGVIEGIVPPGHENKELAGMASFLPSYRIREFVDYAERIMLEQIIDPDLFTKVVDIKERKDRRGTTYGIDESDMPKKVEEDDDDDELPDDPNLQATIEGTSQEDIDTPHMDREFEGIVSSLHKKHTPEEVDAILATVEREREEVIKILQTEGGEMDDVIASVRRKTYDEKHRIMEEIEREMMGQKNTIEEGEIISSEEDKKS